MAMTFACVHQGCVSDCTERHILDRAISLCSIVTPSLRLSVFRKQKIFQNLTECIKYIKCFCWPLFSKRKKKTTLGSLSLTKKVNT